MRRLALLCLGALALVGAVLFWRLAERPGPVLYVGGPILTLDPEDRVVEALAVEGERIAAVGSERELRAWAEKRGAGVVELGGRAVVPGFIDAHGHFPGSGLTAVHADLNSPPIGTVERIDQLVERMQEHAAARSAGDWVLGIGYDDTLLAERRHPTRQELDLASRDHPIAVLHISGHLAVANSLGLERLGIGRDTPDPEGGVIRRDPATGEPNGVLEETAMEAIGVQLQPGALDGLRIVRRASQRYLQAGVTTAQSGLTDAGLMATLTWLSRLGVIPLRLVLWPDAEAAQARLDAGAPPEAGPWVRVGAVKLVADGSIQGYTGYLTQPYAVPPGDDPSYRGYPRMPREELIDAVGRFHAAGLQIAVHGNGDAAIDDILDAFEAAQRAHPRADARHVVIHAQMTRDDQLDRMRALGVVPSFFSLHTFYWGDRHRTRFMGPERAARMSPAGGAVRRGMRFTIHADAPVVPMEPLRLMWAAVNRRTRTGVVLGEDQHLTPMQALRAVTIDAAWQHFEEADKGSLEPGKLADLVVLSRSPLDDPEHIDEIEVLETLIGGRTLYRADAD